MILSKLLDIAVKNTLKQYFSPEENGVWISYMVIEKSQFLIWGVYYSPPCTIHKPKRVFSEKYHSCFQGGKYIFFDFF